MKKIYVLDTNILLSNKLAPLLFDEHIVVIPLVVLEELDNIKMRKNDLSRDAQAAIRVLDDITENAIGDLQDGIVISESCDHKVHPEAKLVISTTPIDFGYDNDCADNIIINTALQLQHEHELGDEYQVVLVSNDTNCRVKAKAAGLAHTQKLKSNIVVEDTDYLPQGVHSVDIDWIDNLSETPNVKQKSCGGIQIPLSALPIVNVVENYRELCNTWLYNSERDWAAEIKGFEEIDDMVYVNLVSKNLSSMMKRRCSTIQGRDVNQTIAIDALMDDDKDIVILFGPAGSGKTLLALAAASEMVHSKKKNYHVDEIIFGKTMDSQFEQIGFLPGNEHEKLAPWAGAVYDNMETLCKLSKKPEYHPKSSIEDENKSFVKLKNLGFMRGRSISHRVIIIDEAQNLNSQQMKTLLSRAGENCKVIVLGNLAQIDNEYVSENSSGLTYICKKFAEYEHSAIIHLEGVQRSRLANFAENNL